MRVLTYISLLTLSLSVVSSSKPFPKQVDLSHLIDTKPYCQTGGTCHVHADVYQFEAMCYKYTGKRVRLNREFLIFHHLYERMKEKGLEAPDEYEQEEGLLSNEDGLDFSKKAAPLSSLDRILGGIALAESEVKDKEPFYQYFTDTEIFPHGSEWAGGLSSVILGWSLQSSVDKILRDPKQKQSSSAARCMRFITGLAGGVLGYFVGYKFSKKIEKTQFPDTFKAKMTPDKLDKLAQDVFGGKNRKTSDATLKQCLKLKLRQFYEKGSIQSIQKYLSQGIPVSCIGVYEDKKITPSRVDHVTLATGYRWKNGKFQLRIQNTMLGDSGQSWWDAPEGCKTIKVLTK